MRGRIDGGDVSFMNCNLYCSCKLIIMIIIIAFINSA